MATYGIKQCNCSQQTDYITSDITNDSLPNIQCMELMLLQPTSIITDLANDIINSTINCNYETYFITFEVSKDIGKTRALRDHRSPPEQLFIPILPVFVI